MIILSEQEIKNIHKKFPLLEYNESEQLLTGYIEIGTDDRYHLRIDISIFPTHFPKVIELNERIPRKPDRHVTSKNTLCFTTRANEVLYLQTSVKNIEDFIELILVYYLINNSYYEINRKYRFGEHSHCPIESAYEGYQDILGIKDNVFVFLLHVMTNHKYKPNDKCYCGSRIKIKNCGRHKSLLEQFKKLYKNGSLNECPIIAIINYHAVLRILTDYHIQKINSQLKQVLSDKIGEEHQMKTINPHYSKVTKINK